MVCNKMPKGWAVPPPSSVLYARTDAVPFATRTKERLFRTWACYHLQQHPPRQQHSRTKPFRASASPPRHKPYCQESKSSAWQDDARAVTRKPQQPSCFLGGLIYTTATRGKKSKLKAAAERTRTLVGVVVITSPRLPACIHTYIPWRSSVWPPPAVWERGCSAWEGSSSRGPAMTHEGEKQEQHEEQGTSHEHRQRRRTVGTEGRWRYGDDGVTARRSGSTLEGL